MAARNHLKQTARLFSSPRKREGLAINNPNDDFDESDIWCCQPDPRKPLVAPKSSHVTWSSKIKPDHVVSGCSMPMNIPDWSKMLASRSCNGNSGYDNGFDSGYEEEEEEERVVVPPHEVIMRRTAASLSVVEGVGRTLKGRDLSRVRDAIWAQTGFQD